MDSHLAHHFTNHNNKIKCQELSELWAQLGQSNWPRMENFSNAFYGHFTTQNLCGKRDGWTSVPDSVTVKCEKNRQNWPKIDEANEEHNKWHTYKYVLYLPVCVLVVRFTCRFYDLYTSWQKVPRGASQWAIPSCYCCCVPVVWVLPELIKLNWIA